VFGAVIALDNFGIGFAGVALVTYMSSLTSIGYTATQYALLSSAYTYVGKFAKGFSGVIVERLAVGRPLIDAYGLFFIFAGLLGVPALVLCIFLATGRSPVYAGARRATMTRTATSRARTAALVLLLAGAAAAHASGASLFDPALRFRSLPTEHFVIYFHQGEDALAQRLARIAEDAWRALERPLGPHVPSPHPDRAGRSDRAVQRLRHAVPYNTVVLYAVTPSGSSSDFDDWLRLVFNARVHPHRPSRIADPKAGHASRAASSAANAVRLPQSVSFCRPGRWKGSRPTKRARSPGKAAFMPATSAPSSARPRGRGVSSRSIGSMAA